jgi:hypothetical protein
MLDQFQVRDLPLFDVVLALESTPLRDVVAALEPSDCRAVLVLDAVGGLRGLVMRDTVLKHVQRLSDMRVGLLPVLGVVELKPEALLNEAARVVSAAGVGAVICRRSSVSDPQAMLRDEMLNLTDWAPLVDARSARLTSGVPVEPRRTPPAVIAL